MPLAGRHRSVGGNAGTPHNRDSHLPAGSRSNEGTRTMNDEGLNVTITAVGLTTYGGPEVLGLIDLPEPHAHHPGGRGVTASAEAYRSKYGRGGFGAAMTTPPAADTTLRLEPVNHP